MAFVFRAERELKYSTIEDNDISPGEYQSDLTNNGITNHDSKFSVMVPFNSSSPRVTTDFIQKNKTPGPGAYEKITPKVNFEPVRLMPISHKRYNSSDEFYNAIEANVFPSSLLYTLKKGNKIGFNTKSPRFYNNISFQTINDNPGPGKYNIPDLINPSSQTTEANKIKFSQYPTTFSSNRVLTIPPKDVYGYDVSGDQPKIIPDPNLNMKTSGTKEDTIGPGHYEIRPKWEKHIVDWSKMSGKITNSTHSVSLSPSIINKTSFDNNSNDTKDIIKRCSMKNRMYNIKMNERYIRLNKVRKRKQEQNNILFDSNPGPGYYTEDFDIDNSQKNNSKVLESFSVRSLRFNEKNNSNPNLGPGTYEGLTKPKQKKKFNLKNIHLYNINKDIPTATALKLTLEKKDKSDYIGPGTYELSKSLIKKNGSPIGEFGTKERRFKAVTDEEKGTPGPGAYINSEEFKINIKEENKESEKDKGEHLYDKKVIIEHFEPPPVGTYNPSLIFTMNYKVKSRINAFQNNKKVSFGTQDKRFKLPSHNKTTSIGNQIIGPGLYNKDKPKILKENLYPFNIGNQRFNYKVEGFPNVGPGSYELEGLRDWNKKSHNLLFS